MLINVRNIIKNMKNREGKTKHKKRYSKISIQKRLKLAKLVLEDGLTLTKVAKLLHIKRPTAKVILKRYKENGTFFHKKTGPIRTKDSIGSNNQAKIEQISNQEVSIEIPPEENGEIVKKQEPDMEKICQSLQNQRIGYVVYYPALPLYQSFM